MPRRRDPRLEKQRLSQQQTRERNLVAGIPESCHLDHALSAAIYVHALECKVEKKMDPTLAKLLQIAMAILSDAKDDLGDPKFDKAAVDERIRHRAANRKATDWQRLLRVRQEMLDRKRQKDVIHEPF